MRRWGGHHSIRNGFGNIIKVIDANHYLVSLDGGGIIEAAYYRTDTMAEFAVGHHVYLEQLALSNEWIILSHAFGYGGRTSPAPPTGSGGGWRGYPTGTSIYPTGTASMGWFTVDDDTWGLVDGGGRIIP